MAVWLSTIIRLMLTRHLVQVHYIDKKKHIWPAIFVCTARQKDTNINFNRVLDVLFVLFIKTVGQGAAVLWLIMFVCKHFLAHPCFVSFIDIYFAAPIWRNFDDWSTKDTCFGVRCICDLENECYCVRITQLSGEIFNLIFSKQRTKNKHFDFEFSETGI